MIGTDQLCHDEPEVYPCPRCGKSALVEGKPCSVCEGRLQIALREHLKHTPSMTLQSLIALERVHDRFAPVVRKVA